MIEEQKQKRKYKQRAPRPQTEETKRKISEKLKGITRSEETRKKNE